MARKIGPRSWDSGTRFALLNEEGRRKGVFIFQRIEGREIVAYPEDCPHAKARIPLGCRVRKISQRFGANA